MNEKPPPPPSQPPTPGTSAPAPWRTFILVAIAIALGIWLWSSTRDSGEGEALLYSEFRNQVEAGQIERVVLGPNRIEGTLREDAGRFHTFIPTTGDETLLTDLRAHDVEIETQPAEDDTSWWTFFAILPLIFLVGLVMMAYRNRAAALNAGQPPSENKAKLFEKREESTTFADVAGAEGPKAELSEIIDFLKHPERFRALGATMPTGVLLVGPPGTGKTLLARAVAGEAGVPFLSITGSDFMEMYVGVGASRVRAMFKDARETAPSIVFIDEIDSIGRKRGAGVGGGHDEREQTLNQLLSEMDGFEAHEQVVVIAATNRPDILDHALQRPGRFDRIVTIDLPSVQERRAILAVHASNKPLDSDIDLDAVARSTPGFSGADLRNLLNESALLAARGRESSVNASHLDEARDKVMIGLRRDGLTLTPEEVRLLAYHESGHALVAALVPNTDPIHKVTIVPRGRAMGVTVQLPERDRYVMHAAFLHDRLAVLLGGRAAETLVFDTATTGAENDLKEATRLARKMILHWGMSPRLGHLALDTDDGNVFLGQELTRRPDYSEATAREVDEEIRTLLHDAHERAAQILTTHRNALDALAQALIDRESISGDEAMALIAKHRPDTSEDDVSLQA